MFFAALLTTGLALRTTLPPPIISGGIYPRDVADVLVLYGGGAGDEAQKQLIDVLRSRPSDEHVWADLLALWWRRPPAAEAIEPLLTQAPPLVRDLASAVWPAETAALDESKEARLARIAPGLSRMMVRHAAEPFARALDCYLRSESDADSALDECRNVLRLDPALLPAVRGELFALAALGRSKELDSAVQRALRAYPEDLGVTWRFFEDTTPPASHAERFDALAPYLALQGVHPIGRRALERLLDDPADPPFDAEQFRSLIRQLPESADWWKPARPRLITYLSAHREHLADPLVRTFVIAADRALAETTTAYPSSEQRDVRLLAVRALKADGHAREAETLIREIVPKLRPVHRAAFDAVASVDAGPAPTVRLEALQPLFDRNGLAARVAPTGHPRLVVFTRGECRWTRKLVADVAEQEVTWVSQDVPEKQGTALEFLQASGIDASRVLFTRSRALEAAASVDTKMGIEISPDVFLFDGYGALAQEWEGWPVEGMQVALRARLAQLAKTGERSIGGIVVEETTGIPVPGARLVAQFAGEPIVVATGRDGRFRLEGLPEGVVTVTASKPGIGWGRERLPTTGAETAVLRLHPAGSIVGRVPPSAMTERGSVRVPGPGMRSAVEEDRSFRLDEVPAGEARIEWVRSGVAAGVRVRTATVLVRAGEETEADFADGASVTGRVTLRGVPAAGARLSWVRWEGERPGGNLPTGLATAIAGEDGTYSLDGLEPGHYTVAASVDGTGGYREARLIGEREHTFDVALRGERIDGEVVDASTSAPIPGAQVFAYDRSRSFPPMLRRWSVDEDGAMPVAQAPGSLSVATSGPEGKFALLLDSSASEISVRADGYLPRSRTVDVADTGWLSQPIRLNRAARVRGMLSDELGQSIAGGRIFVRFRDAPGNDVSAISRDDGSFGFDDVPAGPYDLVAAVDGRLAVVQGVAAPEEDPDSSGLLVRLVDAGSLELRGVLPAGTPDPAALPQVLAPGGCDFVRLLSVADDARVLPRLQPAEAGWTLRLPMVPAGDYVLRSPGRKAIDTRVTRSEITAIDLRAP